MNLHIQKLKDRWCSDAFLQFVRERTCCACGAPATASHMISKKRADGSDALAVNACMPLHHVQSTRTSRELLERAGIDIPAQHQKLWREFLAANDVHLNSNVSQEEFEAIVTRLGLANAPHSTRKNWQHKDGRVGTR